MKQIKNQLQVFLKSVKSQGSLTYNISWTLSNKILVIGLPIVFTPVFSRIFSTEQYGLFSIYSTVINNVLILTTLGYSESLLFIKNERKFFNLVIATTLLTCVITLIFSLVIPFLLPLIFSISTIDSVFLSILIVSGLLILSVGNSLQKIHTYFNSFRTSSLVNSLGAISGRVSTLSFGLMQLHESLIFGDLLSRVLTLAINFKIYYHKIVDACKKTSVTKMKLILISLGRYPRYVLPARYLETLSNQLPVFVIGHFFGIQILGHYGLVRGLISLPVTLLGTSVQSALIRRIRDEPNVVASRIIDKIIASVVLLVGLPSILLSLIIRPIVPWALGQKWDIAGEISAVLILLTFHLIVEQILTGVFQLRNKERYLFKFHFYQVLITGLAILIPSFFGMELLLVITVYSFFRSIVSLFRINFILKVIDSGKIGLNIMMGILILVFILGVGWFKIRV